MADPKHDYIKNPSLDVLQWLQLLPLDYVIRLALTSVSALLVALTRLWQPRGSLEVLDYDVTLDVRDKDGTSAYYTKRKKVRLLQSHIRAIDDHAWGDGNPVARYQAKPGALGQRTAVGPRYITPIVLARERRKGDIVALEVRRQCLNALLKRREWLEAEVSHPTKRLRLHVVFPKGRPCKWALVQGRNSDERRLLGKRHFRFLASGRQRVTCELKRPKLHDTYTLQWAW